MRWLLEIRKHKKRTPLSNTPFTIAAAMAVAWFILLRTSGHSQRSNRSQPFSFNKRFYKERWRIETPLVD